MNKYDQVAMIIPSLSPDERLVEVVSQLNEEGYKNIIVVNDGSSEEYNSVFDSCKENGAVVLRHMVNQGKGRGLKTAFNYILENIPDCIGSVSLDSDGQHLVKDIDACADMLTEKQDGLILGCRDFDQPDVPSKSRVGNKVTSKVFKLLMGIQISDTQTGLRAFPIEIMKEFMKVEGERFEYETNMLIHCKELNIPIHEVNITTVYFENNKSTHFRPIIDSWKIFKLFFKFILASLSSSAVDLIVFTIMVELIKDIFVAKYIAISTVVARVISSTYNYLINKNTVFKSDMGHKKTLVRYLILDVLIMTMSAIGVYVLYNLTHINETIVKVFVDVMLFFVSFNVQREWVFRKK